MRKKSNLHASYVHDSNLFGKEKTKRRVMERGVTSIPDNECIITKTALCLS